MVQDGKIIDIKQARAHTDTKERAINRVRQITGNQGGGELRIKNEQGHLINSDTIAPGRESRRRDTKYARGERSRALKRG